MVYNILIGIFLEIIILIFIMLVKNIYILLEMGID